MGIEFQTFDAAALMKEESPAGGRQSPLQELSKEEAELLHQEAVNIKRQAIIPSVESDNEPTTPFFNATNGSATYNPQKEAPHHRWICNELAMGFTPKEVAERTGFSPVTIQYVRAQGWAQKYIADLMQKAGRKIVMAELQGAALDAAKFLTESVRGNVLEQKASDRSKDAWKLLERCFGAVPQVNLHGNIDPSELTDAELATIATGTNK